MCIVTCWRIHSCPHTRWNRQSHTFHTFLSYLYMPLRKPEYVSQSQFVCVPRKSCSIVGELAISPMEGRGWIECSLIDGQWGWASMGVLFLLLLGIPAKPLHNQDIVSVHFNHFPCMRICNKLSRYLSMLTYTYHNVDECWLISSFAPAKV